MPKRIDIESVLVIGAGPIVIGQACEFDYSGMQACRALREEGYRVILVNSNPATIMTDPDSADNIYIEPIEWRTLRRIIEKERPDALLPTMGGQTALNCALELARENVLSEFNVEMIGASQDAIHTAEDRERFRTAMTEIGLESATACLVRSYEQAVEVQEKIGFPLVVRPSFTLGGSGGGIAWNQEEFEDIVRHGLDLSPAAEVLLEESLIGWKEYEMEVVRDRDDNCIIVCAIENLDPMGVHTGDSITVAPAQTLTDKEYQIMRNAALAILRKIGVDTGGSNVQFAVNPEDGRLIVIEMNPRVSRSSALASKATGFPIAKIAAKLAVGYTLNELANEVTCGKTPASFEPAIDYVVTKIPRFTFEKFPHTRNALGTQMKSVGEAMAIGRTFKESLQKAIRSLETGMDGLNEKITSDTPHADEMIRSCINEVHSDRLWYVADGFRLGWSLEELYRLTAIDQWFLGQIQELLDMEEGLGAMTLASIDQATMREYKRCGFSDSRIASLLGVSEIAVRKRRHALKVRPVYKRVDTCAAEFNTNTAYLYSCYDDTCEAEPTQKRKIMVLGGGPNRIGQGIEFDYCCVHAVLALREDGYETIMVNCNPETVSTDYDISDRLYFAPLTYEDVLEIILLEKPAGVILQYGGQTPLKLARSLADAGVPIIGTSPDSIDLAEDREQFQQLIRQIGLKQPPNATAANVDEAVDLAQGIGYPLVVRPSYVLGGRAMKIVHDRSELQTYMRAAVSVSEDAPVLIDYFLHDAIEIDIDVVSDGREVLIGGLMQHIEQAGIHSGDSACSMPPYSLDEAIQEKVREQVVRLARQLNVVGLMNAQMAVQGDDVYILEANPRASRTIPYVSKTIGLPLAKIAARCMVGTGLDKQNIPVLCESGFHTVKEAVFPFIKLPGVDPVLGPEMRSTGEVMGVGRSFGEAFAKAQDAAGNLLPAAGFVLLSVRDADKDAGVTIALALAELDFRLLATAGTAAVLRGAGIVCESVYKVKDGQRPHVVDKIKDGQVALVINTTEGRQALIDSYTIRREAIQRKVCYTTTIAAAQAVTAALQCRSRSVYSLQELHENTCSTHS